MYTWIYVCTHRCTHAQEGDPPRLPAAVEWRACPPVTNKQLDLLSVRDLRSCGHTKPIFPSFLAATALLILAAWFLILFFGDTWPSHRQLFGSGCSWGAGSINSPTPRGHPHLRGQADELTLSPFETLLTNCSTHETQIVPGIGRSK